MFISLILLFFLLVSLICIPVLLYFNMLPYIIIPVVFLLVNLLAFRIWFYHRCRIFIQMNRNIINIDKFIQNDEMNDGYITFSSSGNVYKCQNGTESIIFDLHNFILKRSFIRAFVIRQIRYKTISNKLRIAKLFSIKLKVKSKYNRIFLIIDNKKYLIFVNGLSKNSIISSEISKANFSAMFTSIRTFVSSNSVENINEKVYLDYYKFYKERKNY